MSKVVWAHLVIISIGLLLYVSWSFMRDNPESIQLQIFYWRLLPVSLGVLVLSSFALGFVVSFLIFLFWGTSLFWEARRLRREISSLQQMLDRQLASHPIGRTDAN
jgi:hypothetical protein